MKGCHTICVTPELEVEFQSQLPDAWWRCFQNMSESRAVDVPVHRAVRIILGVIECVERFEAKLERFAFSDFGDLVKGNIEVFDPGSVEKPSLRVPLCA